MVCDCPFEANSPMGLRKHPRRELEIAARMLEQMGFANWQCASPVDSLMNRSEERSWTHPEFKNHLVGRVAFVQDQKYAQQQQRISHLTRGKAFSVMVHLTRQNRLFFGSFDTGMSKIASNFQRSGQSDPSVSTLFLHWVTQAAPGLLEQARHTLCCSACRLLQYSYGYEDGNGECAFSKTDRRCWQKSKMVSWGQQYVDSIKYKFSGLAEILEKPKLLSPEGHEDEQIPRAHWQKKVAEALGSPQPNANRFWRSCHVKLSRSYHIIYYVPHVFSEIPCSRY